MSTGGNAIPVGSLVYTIDAKIDEAERKLVDFERRWAQRVMKIRVEIDPSSISQLSSAISAAIGSAGGGGIGGRGGGGGGGWGLGRGWANAFQQLQYPAAAGAMGGAGGGAGSAGRPFAWRGLAMGMYHAAYSIGQAYEMYQGNQQIDDLLTTPGDQGKKLKELQKVLAQQHSGALGAGGAVRQAIHGSLRFFGASGNWVEGFDDDAKMKQARDAAEQEEKIKEKEEKQNKKIALMDKLGMGPFGGGLTGDLQSQLRASGINPNNSLATATEAIEDSLRREIETIKRHAKELSNLSGQAAGDKFEQQATATANAIASNRKRYAREANERGIRSMEIEADAGGGIGSGGRFAAELDANAQQMNLELGTLVVPDPLGDPAAMSEFHRRDAAIRKRFSNRDRDLRRSRDVDSIQNNRGLSDAVSSERLRAMGMDRGAAILDVLSETRLRADVDRAEGNGDRARDVAQLGIQRLLATEFSLNDRFRRGHADAIDPTRTDLTGTATDPNRERIPQLLEQIRKAINNLQVDYGVTD